MADIRLDRSAEIPDVYCQTNVMVGICNRDLGQPSGNQQQLFHANRQPHTR